MVRSHLRIYNGPEVENSAFDQPARDTVDVKLGDIFPLLADAVASQRTWLDDFADDEINIPADLYEVILAYRHHRRPSA
ncbi:MAG: hypothetical protein WD030_10950 [Pirellulales bacterium]